MRAAPIRFFFFTLMLCALSPINASAEVEEQVVREYAQHVHRSYEQTARLAETLSRSIRTFLAEPNQTRLEEARSSWVKARQAYGRTEAFRFYEGPIDAPGGTTIPEGPEGRLNAWPLNEAHIDAIINTPQIEISRAELESRNATDDEANVSLGWHAIEFLLWGQDLSTDGPGARPASDFVGTEGVPARRRAYLALCTELLLSDLQGLVTAWAPGQQNYRASFEALPPSTALGYILTGLATLSGFEMASERIAVPLDSQSQEDEHSCFSDTTHLDFLSNAEGIALVYFAKNAETEASAFQRLLQNRTPELAEKIAVALRQSVELARNVPNPIDQALLAAENDPRRVHLQRLVEALQLQAELLKAAGRSLGVEVRVSAE